MAECNRLSGHFKIIIVLLFVLIFLHGKNLFAQGTVDSTTGKFKQHIEWVMDPKAFEYKIEIRRNGKTLQSITTEKK